MQLFFPTVSTIRSIQAAQGEYYWSAASAAVLHKQGFGLGDDAGHASLGSEPRCGLVTHSQPWDKRFDDAALVFEGPLEAGVARRLGIETTPLTASRLLFYGADGRLATRSPLEVQRVLVKNRRRLGKKSVMRRLWSKLKREPGPEPFVYRSPDAFWNAETISFQALQVGPDWEPVAWATCGEESQRHLVAARRGNYLVCGLPLLGMLARSCTFVPTQYGYEQMVQQGVDVWSLEGWLWRQVVEHFVSRGCTLRRLAPLPAGCRAAFTVRHDYDRPISNEALEGLLDLYETHGVKSTWGWLDYTFNKHQALRVIERGHEVCLHANAPDKAAFRREMQFLEQECGQPIRGYTAHGGEVGYLGSIQFGWAKKYGMHYGEIAGLRNGLTHPAVMVERGVPRSADFMLMPRHFSLDLGMKSDMHAYDVLCEQIPQALDEGMHCVLMNHPDIHIAQLCQLIESLDLRRVWHTTFQNAAHWARLRAGVECRASEGVTQLRFDDALPHDMLLQSIRASGTQEVCLQAGRQAFFLHRTSDGSLHDADTRRGTATAASPLSESVADTGSAAGLDSAASRGGLPPRPHSLARDGEPRSRQGMIDAA